MIYTIGHKKSYERYFMEQGSPMKKGRDESCVGGSVWKTFDEANNFLIKSNLQKTYKVYGVLASWEKDTENNGNEWNDLLKDSLLVKI